MSSEIMEHFRYDHLPDKLQAVSRPLCELAAMMDEFLPEDAESCGEKQTGLRKLLEAKDCFVRSALSGNRPGIANTGAIVPPEPV
jgi:hypothetical protein